MDTTTPGLAGGRVGLPPALAAHPPHEPPCTEALAAELLALQKHICLRHGRYGDACPGCALEAIEA